MGSLEGSPRFGQTCSDLPFSSILFQFEFLVLGNAPNPDLFSFVSDQIRTHQGNPFLPIPVASPAQGCPIQRCTMLRYQLAKGRKLSNALSKAAHLETADKDQIYHNSSKIEERRKKHMLTT